MSQKNRITASIALVAALALAAPPPTHAAGLRPGQLPAIAAWTRAWTWLIGRLPAGIASKPAERQEKEGGAVIPDGRAGTSSTTPPGVQIGLPGPDGGW
jgi:hypothetical protein